MKLYGSIIRHSAALGGRNTLERVAARSVTEETRVVPQGGRPSIQPNFLGSLIPIPGASSLCKLACRALPSGMARQICEAAC